MDLPPEIILPFLQVCTLVAGACSAYQHFQLSQINKRRYGIHDEWRERDIRGEYVRIFLNKKQHYPDHFFTYMRMSPENFDRLFSIVSPAMKPQLRVGRKRICKTQRLAVTLRYLATGLSIDQLSQTWLISPPGINKILKETLPALWVSLAPIYMPVPTTETFLKNAKEFEEAWKLPFCVGALDGKHVVVDAPKNSGSVYYNYKVG